MKRFLSPFVAAVLALALVAFPLGVRAQVVVQQPTAITSSAITDFGNGPLELRVVQGSAWLFTSQGSGVGSTSGSSTSLTLTATPTTAPCVGCIISGTGIVPGTTVTAFSGTTSITLSAAMTVAASTAVAWGAACPSSVPAGSAAIQASPGGDWPMYTQARICAGSPNGPGAAALSFAIGAH